MNFKILKKSNKSKARLGLIETEHGVVETPCFVPVATQAVIKTLDSAEVEEVRSQMLISNTFWLHLKSSEKVIEKAGGLHKFMNWKKPLMTDSGGFQVFSLGFGRDYNFGSKIINEKESKKELIKENAQPTKVRITDDGAYFRSPIDGKELFLGPKESMKIQGQLGADIIFAFDECTPPLADYNYIKKSLEKTHRWAKECLKHKTCLPVGRSQKQALYGIVQGSKFKDLRKESAQFINKLDFDGFGIGGEFGNNKKQMGEMVSLVTDELSEKKPRHLLGIGHLDDMEIIIKSGIDTFDCIAPTHYARRGIAFTSEGRLDLGNAKYLKKNEKLDKNCVCPVCMNYKKNYICHLLRAKEITPLKLLTQHNLWHFNTFVEDIRQKIKDNKI